MLSINSLDNLPRWAPYAIIAIVVALIYGHTLDVPFYLDDKTSITDNPAIKHLGDFSALWHYSKLRIVSYFTFALNYHFGGLDLAGYHIVNILIHLLTGCAVFAFCQEIVKAHKEPCSTDVKSLLPILTALLFVCHPLQTQAVTYLAQRSASLAALFYITSMFCYVKLRVGDNANSRLIWGILTVLFAGFSFFTKQNTITLPVALLLVEIVFLTKSVKNVAKGLAVAGVGILVFFGVVFSYFDFSQFSLESIDAWTRETTVLSRGKYLAIQVSIVWDYIRLFFFPKGLHLDYYVNIESILTTSQVVIAGGGHLLLIGLALIFMRRLPYICFGILFYYLAHLVESSIIPIRDIVFEHRTYLPNLGLCIGVAYGLSIFAEKKKKPALLVILVLLLGLGLATWDRNNVWRDPAVFWKDCVDKAPENPRPYLHLAQALDRAGNLDDADFYHKEAIRLKPNYYPVQNFYGVFLAKQGKYKESIPYFLKAVDLKGNDPKLHNNLGLAYINTGKPEEAKFHLRETVRLQPNYANGHNSLGQLLLFEGDLENAQHHLEKAVYLKPDDYKAHINLADTYRQQGNLEGAIKHYNYALRLNSSLVNIHNLIGVMYKKTQNYSEAIKHFTISLKMNPNQPNVRKVLENTKILMGGR